MSVVARVSGGASSIEDLPSSRWTSPARRRRTVVLAAVATAMLLIGITVTRFLSDDDPAGSSTAMEPIETAPRPVAPADGSGPTLVRAGLDVGFAHDEPGAVAAGISYATASQRWLYFTDDEIRSAIAEIATPIAAARMADDVVLDVSIAREQLGASSGRIWWLVRLLAWRLEHHHEDEARVSVWVVTILSATEVAAPQSEYVTVTLDLAWVDGDWRVDGVRALPGRRRSPARRISRGTRSRSTKRSTGSAPRRGAGPLIVAIGFPNPIGWVIDKVAGFVGGVATAGFEVVIGGLVAWIVDAVVWVVGGVFNFFLDSTDPNVQADWFLTGDGPCATTLSIGASLLLLFVLAGIVQGTLSGDVGGMLRRIGLELPMSIIGMVGLVTVTQILIQLTDALSGEVLGNFQDDISEFGAVVATPDDAAALRAGGARGTGTHPGRVPQLRRHPHRAAGLHRAGQGLRAVPRGDHRTPEPARRHVMAWTKTISPTAANVPASQPSADRGWRLRKSDIVRLAQTTATTDQSA